MIRFALSLLALFTGQLVDAGAQSQARQVDTTEVLVIPRALDSVRAERDQVVRLRSDADARYSVGRARIAESESQRDVIEKEIEAVERRISVAKKEKREADKTALELEKKDLERRRDLVQRRLDLRKAEAALAQAEMDFADASIRALDFEIPLVQRRTDQADRNQLVDLETKTLEAKLEQEYRRKTLADRRQQLIEKRLAVMEAQRTFFKR